jgi:hypothetical protein
MAINIPIITEFSDKGLKSAQGAFNQFKTEVGKAQGAMGKFKAGSTVAFDTIKANAGMFALSAGVAIGGFALKAVNDFKTLALAVDDFRNKTNLTLLQSSQWMSYSGDLGISADSITKIFSRLAKAATDQVPAFEELGVAIAFGPDGSTDIERTFLAVNDAINSLDDPVKQAAYRAELFGRGWMDAAEILQMSSSDIQTALAGVKDFEVIDEEEIQKAKDLRAAQDELADALARISVTIGEALIPAFTDAVEAVKPLIDIFGAITQNIDLGGKANDSYAKSVMNNNIQIRAQLGLGQKILSWLGYGKKQTEELTETQEYNTAALKAGNRAMINAYYASQDLADSILEVDDALAELTGNIDERRTFRKLQDGIDSARDAALQAFTEATPEALRRSQSALDDLRLDVAQYVHDLETIPDSLKTEIIASLDKANLQEIENLFNQLARRRNVDFRPTVGGIPVGVGETPSEVLGRTAPAPIGFRSSTSSTNVTINMPTGVQPNDVVKAINDWTRSNGSLTTPVTSSVRR